MSKKQMGDATVLHLLAGNSSSAAYASVQTLLSKDKDPNCK